MGAEKESGVTVATALPDLEVIVLGNRAVRIPRTYPRLPNSGWWAPARVVSTPTAHPAPAPRPHSHSSSPSQRCCHTGCFTPSGGGSCWFRSEVTSSITLWAGWLLRTEGEETPHPRHNGEVLADVSSRARLKEGVLPSVPFPPTADPSFPKKPRRSEA